MKTDHTVSARVLREGRERLGITQRAMADAVGMESSDYTAAENGRRGFPIARIWRLPHGLALKVIEAMLAEIRHELMAMKGAGSAENE